MSTANQELARRWFEEVWNQQRREMVAELMHADAVLHEGGVDTPGTEAFLRYFDQMHLWFSDIHVTVESVVGEGDLVCVRWSCTMKHTGPAFDVAPTGKSIHATGMTMLRIADGKLVEGWQNWDMLGVFDTLGLFKKEDNFLAVAAHSGV